MVANPPSLDREHFRATRRQYAFCNQQGQFCEVKVKSSHSECPTDVGRGVIRGFSYASRLKLLKFIARIDWGRVGKCIWITLTYPDKYAYRGYKARTQDRYLFFRAVELMLGRQVARLWRTEWEPRESGEHVGEMVCHHHFIVFRCGWVDKDWIKEQWKKVLGYDKTPITWVDGLDNAKKAGLYASKYAGKSAPFRVLDNAAYLNMTGRAWGINRKQLIPLCKLRTLEKLDADQLGKAMWIAGSLKKREYLGSYFVIGKDARHVFCRIAGKDLKTFDA